MAVDYKYTLMRLKNYDPDEDYYKKLMSEAHLRGAHRLLDLCRSNRGVFIKVNAFDNEHLCVSAWNYSLCFQLIQHAASLQFALPLEYYSVLAGVRSVALESPMDELRRVFNEELGKEVVCFCLSLLFDTHTHFSSTTFSLNSIERLSQSRRLLKCTKRVCERMARMWP